MANTDLRDGETEVDWEEEVERRFSNLSLLRYITDLSKLNGDGVRGKLLKGWWLISIPRLR